MAFDYDAGRRRFIKAASISVAMGATSAAFAGCGGPSTPEVRAPVSVIPPRESTAVATVVRSSDRLLNQKDTCLMSLPKQMVLHTIKH